MVQQFHSYVPQQNEKQRFREGLAQNVLDSLIYTSLAVQPEANGLPTSYTFVLRNSSQQYEETSS